MCDGGRHLAVSLVGVDEALLCIVKHDTFGGVVHGLAKSLGFKFGAFLRSNVAVRPDHAQRPTIRGANRLAHGADPDIFVVRQAAAAIHFVGCIIFQMIVQAPQHPRAVVTMQPRDPRIVVILDVEAVRALFVAKAEEKLISRRTSGQIIFYVPIPNGGLGRLEREIEPLQEFLSIFAFIALLIRRFNSP